MPNQISIWFIHEQCFGVYTIRILWSLWCRNSARLSWFFNIPDLPLLPRSSDNPHCPATKRTRLSDLCIFKPSQTNVHGVSGSVSINARMASTKSFSVRVLFKYGFSIRPVATSKKPMRLLKIWSTISRMRMKRPSFWCLVIISLQNISPTLFCVF